MSRYAFFTRRRIRVALILSTGAIAWTGLAAIAFASATQPALGDLSPTATTESRLAISRQDSAYALSMLQGPPGQLTSLAFAGDSAHVVWNLGPEEMFIDLRGTGDSLVGTWSTADWRGEAKGVRRR